MKYHYQKLIEPLEIFLMNDQPFTCPYCGTRGEMIARFNHTLLKRQIEQCLNYQCDFICYEEDNA